MDKPVLHFFKRNVPYVVGLRYYIGDSKGKVLNDLDPYIAIEDEDLRDFKRANKDALQQGLIITTSEPDIEDTTANAITDEKAAEIVKNVFILKKTLASVNSEAIVAKLLEIAQEQDRPKKTIALIKARLEEVADISPFTMRGVVDGAPEDSSDKNIIY